MCIAKIYVVYFSAIIFLNIEEIWGITIPKNPCPHIFLYKYYQQLWFGEISITSPSFNVGYIELQINMSLGSLTENGYTGTVIILGSDEEIMNNIKTGSILKYRVNFPLQSILPLMTAITVNGVLICSGPAVENPPFASISLSRIITWIENSAPSQTTVFSTTTEAPNQRWPHHECGVAEIFSSQELIINGEDVSPQPWLVALYTENPKRIDFFCAGNLVSDRHVVTSANCIKNKSFVLMKLGKHSSQFHEQNSVYRYSKRIYTHPEYREDSSHFDISIVLLIEPVSYSENIKPLCMLPRDQTIPNIIGDIGTISGWGNDETGLSSIKPKIAKVQITSLDTCRSNDRLRFTTSDTTICAIGKASEPCSENSSGALVMLVNQKWTLRGIISTAVFNYNANACYAELAVFADVAKSLNWFYRILNTL